MTRLLVDAHLDLAWNALTFGRDYSLTNAEIRQREAGGTAPQVNGDTLLGRDAFQAGRVALVFATLYATPIRARSGLWSTQYYATSTQAAAICHRQVDFYRRLVDEHPDLFRLVSSRQHLSSLIASWAQAGPVPPPTGITLLMEGADCIRDLRELEEWWELGVRTIGPAWMGTRFCGGTNEPGPLTSEGIALLESMADFGFTLDLSHMDSQAALQSLDRYPGPLIATHSNALSLLKGETSNRHLPDEVIRGIVARGGVIGVVIYNSFLKPGWKRTDSRQNVTLQHLVAQIDTICQLAGDARHVGIGTDADGGFGVQEVPEGIDTIADLHRLAPLLAEKGYTDPDIDAIFGGNWLTHLNSTLPETE
jgi:membrane dipeptidase